MTKPLSGTRVIDLTTVISGPMATSVLADQGADVIKVETPGAGDMVRYLGSQRGGVSAMFETVNRNKRSVVLDLKQPEGREILLRLVESADVFVENFRPGAANRLGLSYDALTRIKTDLVYATIRGFGDDGPYAGKRVYDSLIQALSGVAAAQADPGKGPQLVQTLICDKVTALTGAQAITAALFAKQATGRPQRLQLSMLDSAIAFLWPDGMYNHTFLPDEQIADAPPFPEMADFYRIFETADGHVTLLTVSDAEYAAGCRALDLGDMENDPRFCKIAHRMGNGPELMAMFEKEIASRSTGSVIERCDEEDAPAAHVNSREDVAKDEQVLHNRTLVERRHPSGGNMRVPRPAAVFGEQPEGAGQPSPMLGEHTEEVLGELGIGTERLSALKEQGVI